MVEMIARLLTDIGIIRNHAETRRDNRAECTFELSLFEGAANLGDRRLGGANQRQLDTVEPMRLNHWEAVKQIAIDAGRPNERVGTELHGVRAPRAGHRNFTTRVYSAEPSGARLPCPLCLSTSHAKTPAMTRASISHEISPASELMACTSAATTSPSDT